MTKVNYEIKEGTDAHAAFTAWRDEMAQIQSKHFDFAESIGASRIFSHYYGRPTAFEFTEKDPPEGWTQPKSRNGASWPKKSNKADLEKIAELPCAPSLSELCEKFGLEKAAPWNGWRLAWCQTRLFVYGQHWDDVIPTKPDWAIPISDAALDLVFLQRKVDKESEATS